MLEPIYKSTRHKNAVYSALIKATDCGPFDGGCLAFATAMQEIHGGVVQVVDASINERPSQAQHAILRLQDGSFLDGSGRGSQDAVVACFVTEEIQSWGGSFRLSSVRDYRPGDLPDAVCNAEIVKAIVEAWQAPDRKPSKRP